MGGSVNMLRRHMVEQVLEVGVYACLVIVRVALWPLLHMPLQPTVIVVRLVSAAHSAVMGGIRDELNTPIRADIQNNPRNLPPTKNVSIISVVYGKRYAPFFVSVDYAWSHSTYICACADHEEDNQEERLKIEQRGLGTAV